ncbi:o-methyltransferase [Hirsutella rhossiliensis]|uniref:O-methyltransferase domain-containing protein n=1 Tax=Hirsutella rhossiliensis TaxID=111463 RepID=A0A9P8SNK8_9HYPO|nr:o-methyltransferase domain-containing protein [Hirsutella rhossiliensis]KAH0967985.1 o-methyltransferase domain-containing protein [Hirsutella rhossiliensis]
MIKHTLAQPVTLSAITLGVETGLFSILVQGDGSPWALKELASKLEMQESFLGRLMRHLAAMGYLIETGPDNYLPTNFTRALTLPLISAGYPLTLNAFMRSWVKFPAWAREHNYMAPESTLKTVLQYAFNTDLNMFDFFHSRPPNGVHFDNLMTGYRQGRPHWMDAGFYPVQEKLIQGLKPGADAVLLVDIGGGLGQDIVRFQSQYPEAPGRLVLQDQAVVTSKSIGIHDKIETMSYDFFTEQPVKGARAYYLHSVLHNWPDKACVQILKRVKEAMEPGYSRLLINDQVVPRTGAHWEVTALDLEMMVLLGARERVEEEWYQLLENMADLRVEKIWTLANGLESVIECVLR